MIAQTDLKFSLNVCQYFMFMIWRIWDLGICNNDLNILFCAMRSICKINMYTCELTDFLS